MLIETETAARFLAPGGALSMKVVWYYDPKDPFAVQVRFPKTTWFFARELLRAGLTRPAGVGDVRLFPMSDTLLRLELRGDTGKGVFEFSLAQVRAFAAATYRAVPSGSETSYVDLDREIAALLP